LPPGGNLPWIICKKLNRLRAGVVKTKVNMMKCGYQEGLGMCECGEVKSNEHL